MADILMPKATAVWLIDNTTLTFGQIAEFCGLHHLEVKGIADGDVAEAMRGVDPIAGGELERSEIRKGEADADYVLKVAESKIAHIPQPKRKGARYTPTARRADKPDAIAWFIRNHPEVTDAKIGKLIGTTKTTINAVRDRSHWNSQSIKPVDPVTLGLCSQIELDEIIAASADKRRKIEEQREVDGEGPGITAPDTPAFGGESAVEERPEPQPKGGDVSAADVFKNFEN